MLITENMIRQGVKKAAELAVLPRKGQIEDIATNNELMLEILQAALDAAPEEQTLPNGAHSIDP